MSMKISKSTYRKRVKSFAEESAHIYNDVVEFAKAHCKSKKQQEIFMQQLTAVIDKYIVLHCNMYDWSKMRDVDFKEFTLDVSNAEFKFLPPA